MSGCWGQGVHPPLRRAGFVGGTREVHLSLLHTPVPNHKPGRWSWGSALEFRVPPARSGAAPGGAPAALPGAARCPGRAMNRWGRGGLAGAGGRGATAGQQRQQQQREEEECCLVVVFFSSRYFFFPGCFSFQHLLKQRIVHTCVCFKRCFFSAAKLEEDEGQCMSCTWFSLKIVVLSKMDCESFRGKEEKT